MVAAHRRNRARGCSDPVTAYPSLVRDLHASSGLERTGRRRDRTPPVPGYSPDMTNVEVFIDPSCPWAWVTSRWLLDVAPQRNLDIFWRSYCLEIRDDYGVAPTVPEGYRQQALDGHAVSHRMLRIFEAAARRGWGGGRRPSLQRMGSTQLRGHTPFG